MPSSSALRQACLKGLLFLLPLLAILAYLELGLRRMPNAMSLKRDGFEARAEKAELLVLGASEGYQGLSPDQMGIPGYNLANVGQDLHYDRALFQSVRPRLPRLKAVLLAVSYPCLEYRLPLGPEHWRQFQYSQVWGIAPESLKARWDLRRFSALALTEAWPALKLAKNGFKPEPSSLGPDGWQALDPIDEEQLDLQINDLTARKRARFHDGLLDPARHAEGKAWLEALADEVARSDAKPLFVTLPVTQGYLKAVDVARLKRLRDAVSRVAAKHGSPYWDLSEDPRFEDADFADPDHLDRKGAEKLAKILGAKIKKAGP